MRRRSRATTGTTPSWHQRFRYDLWQGWERLIRGRDGGDDLFGNRGADRILGGRGTDLIEGNEGDDPRLEGFAGRDEIRGGKGDDGMFAHDGVKDTIACDGGFDRVDADARDVFVNRADCEVIN